MFWIGLGVGIFIGFSLGMLTLGFCVLAREADEQSERLFNRKEVNKNDGWN